MQAGTEKGKVGPKAPGFHSGTSFDDWEAEMLADLHKLAKKAGKAAAKSWDFAGKYLTVVRQVSSGMVIFRFLGQLVWDKDFYIMAQEIFAELCEVVDTRPTYIVNVAKGDVRSLPVAFAALADVSLAEPDATFGFPEVRVGGMPACVTVAMRKRVSDDYIRKMITDGLPIDAREAQRVGLVDFVGDVEMELSRIIFRNCKPKVTNVMYRPDCEKAWRAQ
ncbi:hypothetical protein AK812_SmicGene41626 [Symbiodinium microadriaticum]|uniref:Uncharacterized protein n=2 Tax=Symbiodinium TaxID=2949 RepID=A0A1Q9C5M5_SYMMI|nr:hypothetical protein AK812_SmicGene41626 [Symbiodinium microadriaticum]